jgi:hypothetical protein
VGGTVLGDEIKYGVSLGLRGNFLGKIKRKFPGKISMEK